MKQEHTKRHRDRNRCDIIFALWMEVCRIGMQRLAFSGRRRRRYGNRCRNGVHGVVFVGLQDSI
jgi:hypothetical protein